MSDAEPKSAPNVHAALGHELLAASSLVGRETVQQFFRDEIGKIVSRHLAVDPLGLKAKCQDDFATLINSLMDNP